MKDCQDCGDKTKRRKRCQHCDLLVCGWCWHHVHTCQLGHTRAQCRAEAAGPQEYHVRCLCGMRGPRRLSREEACDAWNETPADPRWLALLDQPDSWEARLFRWNKYLIQHYRDGYVWGDRYPDGISIREFVDRMLDPQALGKDLAKFKPRPMPKPGKFGHAGGQTHGR
jgi:hypothetical protein